MTVKQKLQEYGSNLIKDLNPFHRSTLNFKDNYFLHVKSKIEDKLLSFVYDREIDDFSIESINYDGNSDSVVVELCYVPIESPIKEYVKITQKLLSCEEALVEFTKFLI